MVGQSLSNAGAGAPDLLQQYELLGEIGASARARVSLARDRVFDQEMAVKLFHDAIGGDHDLALRLYRVARAAANLHHPNIVAVYDCGAHAGSTFITMEYVAGRDLATLLAEEGTLPPRRAVAIVAQILDALGAAHERGIVHGDLHPHNVLLRGDGDRVALTDFGMGLVQDWAGGLAPYRAPEELAGRPVDPAADIYAAGALLHTMLTGQPPAPGRDAVWAGRPVQRLEPPIRRALARTPAERYPTAAAFREALIAISGPVTPPPPAIEREDPATSTLLLRVPLKPATAPPRRLRWDRLLGLIGALLLVLLAVALGLAWTARNRTAATPTVAAIAPSPAAEEPAAEPSIAPTATLVKPAAAPTEVPVTSAPTAPPEPAATATGAPVAPTAAPALPTPAAPTSVPTAVPTPAPPTPTAAAPVTFTLASIAPAQLGGAYRRNDGTLYGRSTVALYGASSGFDQGTLTFDVPATPTVSLVLVLTGLDDELSAHCTLAVIINDATIFLDADTFPNTPASDHGVGGTARYWDQMAIALPQGLLHAGTNTLTLQNRTAGSALGVPYILISDVAIEAR